ncbi:TPR domain protein, putative component of TonB system [Moritella sp. JT01]|uniref:tetratricopeptide repeat protein n=1 Tax=Moritella sp. JT01 TaxID=756698 RepID=UPI000796676C|nr:tetratricopeptide repeat protein [Moritella sp. JT01]KXO12505.1 TPR domain protein, putative component of TonB system [Moritella sp. JT01]
MKLIDLNIQIEIVFTALLLSGVILLAGCSESSDLQNKTDPDIYIQQSKSYLDGHQFRAAFNAATEAINADPNRLESYLILASIHLQSGHPRDSIKVLEDFTGSKNVEYYFALLDAYQMSNKLISAQQLIEQKQQLLSTQAQRLQLSVAQQLLHTDELEQAKTTFSQLLEDPDYKVDSMLGLAKIEVASDNEINAINIIDNIIEIAPENTDALFLKSLIYINMGELNNAEEALSQTLASLPNADIFTVQRIKIFQSLAHVLTQQGRLSEAKIYTRILSDEFPMSESLSLQYTQALNLFQNEEFSAAKEILLEILDGSPGHKKSAVLLGLILYNEGNPQHAEKYLIDIIDPEVSPTKLTELYVKTLLQQNKYDNVLDLLKYIPETSRDTDTWILYISAAIQQKEFSKAKKGLDKAMSLSPKSERVALLAFLYYSNLPEPQPEMALQTLSSSLTFNPESPKLQTLYIRQLLTLNKTTEVDNYVASLEETYSKNTNTQLIIASYYMYQQRLHKAIPIIENILVSEKDNIQALYTMAKINNINKNWQLSLNNYNDIIKFYPTEITAYKGAILSLMKLKKDPLKTADYLHENYNASVLALTLAHLSLQQNRLDLADNYAKEANNELPKKYQVNLDELTVQVALLKARTALIEKDYLKAREIVTSTTKNYVNNVRLLSLLTHIEIASGQYNEAQSLAEQINQLLPDNSLATLFNSQILNAKGEKNEAIKLLHSYWNKVKDRSVAEQLYLQLKTNSSEKAFTFLDEWQNEFPDSLIPTRYKAIYLQEQGENKQAIAIYNSILQKAPNEIISLNNTAWLSFEAGIPQALSFAERAYKLKPNNAAILDTYGWILFHNGDINRGKALIKQASKLLPNDKNIQQHLDEVSKG